MHLEIVAVPEWLAPHQPCFFAHMIGAHISPRGDKQSVVREHNVTGSLLEVNLPGEAQAA